MEIDITTFLAQADPFEFSASRAERGQNAGPETWRNALNEAASAPLLATEAELRALRDHVQAMGFSEDVQAYGAQECNALFIQLISGDLREAQSLVSGDGPAGIDWRKYERLASKGTIGGTLFATDEGRVFYTLGE